MIHFQTSSPFLLHKEVPNKSCQCKSEKCSWMRSAQYLKFQIWASWARHHVKKVKPVHSLPEISLLNQKWLICLRCVYTFKTKATNRTPWETPIPLRAAYSLEVLTMFSLMSMTSEEKSHFIHLWREHQQKQSCCHPEVRLNAQRSKCCSLTLEGWGWGLGHLDMLFVDQVDGLVLSNLHTCAHIAFPMKKEREGTRQMFTGEGETKEKQIY